MNLDRIQELLKLMEAHDLAEIEVEGEGFKVRLKKREEHLSMAPAPSAAPQPVAKGAPAQPQAQGGAGAEWENSPNLHVITSPIVGSFYRAPSPDAEPFVEPGDPVEPDTVVCIVEAMKVMNEVKAETYGTIQKVLVENGKPVEYGQPLFLVAKS